MPTAPTVIKCRHSRCSYSSTDRKTIEDHNETEHFECSFCGPIGELYSRSGYHAHLQSHNTQNSAVIPGKKTVVIPQKGATRRQKPCRFTPRCPYTGPKFEVKRHSRCVHMECPVNGCDAFLSRKLFFKHIKETHRDQFDVQCPQAGCSTTSVSLVDYWTHGLSHVNTGSEERVLHLVMGRCSFAPRCPYTGAKSKVERHSRVLHIDCPVNGCDAIMTKPAFMTHVGDKHSDQITVQCPRDACSSRDINLGGYWDHVLSHVDTSREEHLSHPAMVRCTFAPRCPYICEGKKLKPHSLRLHIECPVNGCDAFLTKPTFMAHVRDKHSDQSSVPCPQDGCSTTSVLLLDYWVHGLGHINTGSEEGVLHTGRCTFAPRCPYTGVKSKMDRHSRSLHMECPVNGCDAFVNSKMFFKHAKETHRDQFHVQCPRDDCPSRDVILGEYWKHALSHVGTGSEERVLHPGMGRCSFAPRCPYMGEKDYAAKHSRLLHMECPVNGCDAFVSSKMFFKHAKETHRDQFHVQCPRDDCSSRDVILGEYWKHALSHVDTGDEEDVQGNRDEIEVEPEISEGAPLSWDVFRAAFHSRSQGMMRGVGSNMAESNTDWDMGE